MKKQYFIWFGSFILALFIVSNCFSIVKQNEYGVVKQFGKNIRIQEEAGIVFKIPFIQTVKKVDKSYQIYDLESTNVNTSDKKSMISDCFTLWRIEDPDRYTKTLKTLSQAEKRLSVNVYSGMKSIISSLQQEDVIRGKDGTLSDSVTNRVINSMTPYGVEIQSVDIKALDLPSANKDAVYERMITERNNIAAGYTAEGEKEAQLIINQTDQETRTLKSDAKREAEEIIAEGEAEYMKIIATAYGSEDKKEFYNYLRGLQSAKTAIPKDSTIYMDSTSPLVDVIKGEADEK